MSFQLVVTSYRPSLHLVVEEKKVLSETVLCRLQRERVLGCMQRTINLTDPAGTVVALWHQD